MASPIPVFETESPHHELLQLSQAAFLRQFQIADPSTINNTPNNYDPTIYPTPDELQEVELYWNPKGKGGFEFYECVVTRVDYSETESSTTREDDPIIGQPVSSVMSAGFPLGAALVDLDPMQQNVTEIWGMNVQIGGASANLAGNFTAVSFCAILGQAQGKHAPHSSASGSGVYQSKLKNTKLSGADLSAKNKTAFLKKSKFFKYFADHPTASLSINFNLNTHNNNPPIWRFNAQTFQEMADDAKKPAPQDVLQNMAPMQTLVQNLNPDFTPKPGFPGVTCRRRSSSCLFCSSI